MNMNICGARDLAVSGLMLVALGAAEMALCQDVDNKKIDLENLFTPSGWMGDGVSGREYIDFSGASRATPHSPPSSMKIVYKFGPKRWAGIYWQNEPDNWGDSPGNNYADKALSKVTFWAKGQTGDEIVEFKSGCIKDQKDKSKKYHDSFCATSGRQSLTTEWKQYSIDLSKADLTSMIGGFSWVASADHNSGRQITFYLDDIVLE